MARPPHSQILALDIGSSSVRSALFDETGRRVVRSSASRKYSIHYTADEGAELDPNACAARDTTLRARDDEVRARGTARDQRGARSGTAC